MKKKTWIIVLITCIIASILGGLSLYTPMSKGAEKGAFSAERAKEHIKEIAKEPHSIYDVDALNRAWQVYGVPPEIIVGIIGVETRWGRVMG
ncbi:MAG: lytic murein transglycosylase, partial [Clostridium sp.]|nr:lytic murein transglycosylase [Clostridium sp.]